MTRPITVAICTRNRARLLARTLDSLVGLTPTPAEWTLLVVDNGSTDDTAAVCDAFADRLPLRRLSEQRPGLSNARNRALEAASGDHLVFTDDDVTVERDWLAAFAAATSRWPQAAVFGGPIEPDFPRAPNPDLVAAFPALGTGFCGLDHGRPEGPLPDPLPVWGANMAFRRRDLDGLAFDPSLGRTPTSQRGGEEEAFVRQLRARGGLVVWCPQMRLRHYVDPSRMTLEYLMSFYVGQGEQLIRCNGVPTPPTPTLFGAPRWFVRRTIEAYLRYLVARAGSSRVDALKQLRIYCEHRGMLRACRAAGARG